MESGKRLSTRTNPARWIRTLDLLLSFDPLDAFPMISFAKQALVAVALSAALVAGPASSITTGSLYGDVQSAISGSGNVNVSVTDGVATLTGNADYGSKIAAGRAALADASVDRIVNLIDAS